MNAGETGFAVLRAPREVVFGCGVAKTTGKVARRYGKRVLVYTDAAIAATDGFAIVLESLRAEGLEVTVFDGALPEVPLRIVDEAAAIARAARPDVLVAVGGGSVIDLAKVSALLAVHPGPLASYYGELHVPSATAPLIALPTTAGTGSEVTPVAVVTDPDERLKCGVSSPYLVPAHALCDPDLTVGCPPGVTALAGIDALAHAIEAFTAIQWPTADQVEREAVFIGKNGISDVLALEAIGHLTWGLPRAFREGGDRQARSATLYGSLLAGLAFATAGTSAAHALQYPIGAATGTPHGLGVGVLLPYAMAFNAPLRQHELALVAERMEQASGDGASVSEAGSDAGIRAAARVQALMTAVDVPLALREIGVTEQSLPELATLAASVTRLTANNPRPLDEPALARLLRAAWDGTPEALRALAA